MIEANNEKILRSVMLRRRALIAAGSFTALLGLGNCAAPTKPVSPARPYITYILVEKNKRAMHLYHNKELYKTYRVALGFRPNGHKMMRNDGRTPEGRYFIDRVNPQSAFHLSLGINYPNQEDRARAAALGVDPGSDIFIHGGPTNATEAARGPDWTAGCIAVTNREIEEIYSLAGVGTMVDIRT